MTETTLDNPAKDLDDLLARIGKSINNESATSSGTARLREKAMRMVEKIQAHADESRKQMLEPLLPRVQIEEAKRNAEAAAVDCQRLEAAIELLSSRADDLAKLEQSAKRAQRYLSAQVQRDRTAAFISDRFPALQAEYLTMIEEIMESSNAAVDLVNLDLPDDMPPLERPEGLARGFKDQGSYDTATSFQTFRITQSMLPSAKSSTDIAWPKLPIYEVGVLQQYKGFTQRHVMRVFAECKATTKRR